MRAKTILYLGAAIGTGALIGGQPAPVSCQQNLAAQGPAAAIEIDGYDIGGVVTSRFGPESGVWVIA